MNAPLARLLLLTGLAPLSLSAAGKDSCLDCHASLSGSLQEPVARFANDIHRQAGIGCATCHGGDNTSTDPKISMSPARGFTGKIARTKVPALCAKCHSDAGYMQKFKPQQRVDQFAQYQTSVHGKRLAAGDAAAANCVDCHSVHDIREVKNALSPVHPLRLPETCARCHASATHMAGYKLPVTQFEEYRTSVHWEALSKRRDLSAPSCASCHGNHGAKPPQATSVAAVCGTCHALQEDLYKKSPHQPVFSGMGVAGCVACHTNHGVQSPSEKMLAGDGAVCVQCHDAESAGGKVAAGMHGLIRGLESSVARSSAILLRARVAGMEVSDSLLRLQEAQEALVKARVAVHAFRTDAVGQPVKEGMKIAEQSFRDGQSAMQERDVRRAGLAVSLIAILITIAGLWLAIRRIEARRMEPQER